MLDFLIPVINNSAFRTVFSFQIPFDRDIGDHRERVHGLGPARTASSEHQRRNTRGAIRRPGRGARDQYGRFAFGEPAELVLVCVRLSDQIRRLSTGECRTSSTITTKADAASSTKGLFAFSFRRRPTLSVILSCIFICLCSVFLHKPSNTPFSS